MIQKTRNYEQFKFREDNRDRIDQKHLERLRDSISARNLLEMRPILVNKEMEVIDGQHRLLAAKRLETDIYYRIEEKLTSADIILMNTAKAWLNTDYFNYYVKNGYEEYIKLKNFMQENQMNLQIAIKLTLGTSYLELQSFRNGNYVFKESGNKEDIEKCKSTIEFIKRMNGPSTYTKSGKFWKALIKLVQDVNFDQEKWLANMSKMISRFGPRISTKDYLQLFMDVFNYRNPVKVDLLE